MTLQMGSSDRQYLRFAPPRPRSTSNPTRLVDLFSGCGGLTLGVIEAARQSGRRVDVRLAVERDRDIAQAYARNFAPTIGETASVVESWFDRAIGRSLSMVERRTRRDVGPVDILVGGPPCQGHSTLNNHTRGDDPKNALYLVVVRAAEVLRPTSIIIENVPAIERDSRGTLPRAVKKLERLGYGVDIGIVSVAEIGVPQLRKRHVLIAHCSAQPSVAVAIEVARVSRERSLRWAIGDLLAREGATPYDTSSVLSPENRRRAQYLLENDEYDLPNAKRPLCQRGDHKYKSMYGRLAWLAPAQTITTGFGSPGQGRYLHPERLRTLTPHEAARLQFIPDWYDFSAIPHRRRVAEAIGNAVPPKLGFVLAFHLLAASEASLPVPVKYAAGMG